MAEAIISRQASGGGDVEISNETKAAIGVSNDATLDECLQFLSLKDENYATIVCTLKDPDDSVVSNGSIKMEDVSGAVLTYTTDSAGQCIFKTNAGSANFYEPEKVYFDLTNGAKVTVDAVIGSVKRIDIQRSTHGNGYNNAITSNQNIKFSRFINTVNICIAGGGGGSGGGWSYAQTGRYTDSGFNIPQNKYSGGTGGNGEVKYYNSFTPTANTLYSINIGAGGTVTNKTNKTSTYNSDYRDDGDYRGAWLNTLSNSIIPVNGSTGGTSKFGSIISANGGAGGGAALNTGVNGTNASIYAVNVLNGSSGRGGKAGIGNVKGTTTTVNKGNYAMWYATATSNGYAGNSGICWVNNFRYKSF